MIFQRRQEALVQNKKISVFWVTGLKILGRVAWVAHIFFIIIFLGEKIHIILYILKGILPFKMH